MKVQELEDEIEELKNKIAVRFDLIDSLEKEIETIERVEIDFLAEQIAEITGEERTDVLERLKA